MKIYKLKITCGCGDRYIDVNDEIIDAVKSVLILKKCPLCNKRLKVENV